MSSAGGPRDIDAISQRNDFVADMIDEAHELRTERGHELQAAWDADLPVDVSVLLDPVGASDGDPDTDLWQRALELAVDLVDRHEG